MPFCNIALSNGEMCGIELWKGSANFDFGEDEDGVVWLAGWFVGVRGFIRRGARNCFSDRARRDWHLRECVSYRLSSRDG